MLRKSGCRGIVTDAAGIPLEGVTIPALEQGVPWNIVGDANCNSLCITPATEAMEWLHCPPAGSPLFRFSLYPHITVKSVSVSPHNKLTFPLSSTLMVNFSAKAGALTGLTFTLKISLSAS